LEKDNENIVNSVVDFIKSFFQDVNVSFYNQEDEIIHLLNKKDEIANILTYVKKKWKRKT